MLQWALLGIAILVLILAYIVIQGTRAALAWRKAAAAGDVQVIHDIVEDAIAVWHTVKRPKEVAPEVWRGVQSMQLVEVAPDFVRVSCHAESEYNMKDGHWSEVTNPLQEGIAVTARVADMLLYELPHYKADRIQIDIYTSFREMGAEPKRACILSTEATRDDARAIDWEDWTAAQVVDALGGRYRLGERGQPLPIEVSEPALPPATEGDSSVAAAHT